MKQTITLLVSIFISHSLLTQDTISVEIVQQFSHQFTIANNSIHGKGGDVLKKECKHSQFVLIGETHDNAEISLFTASIFPMLKKNNFKYFFTENGNNSLQIMINHSNSDSTLQKGMYDFYTQEYKRTKHIALPFFSGKEDALFLESALKHEFTLYGIDQEYFYSFPLLLDELLALSDKTTPIKKAHQEAIEFVLEQYKLEVSQKNHSVCTQLINSKEIVNFFNLLDTTDKHTKVILEDLVASWKIYEQNRLNRRNSFKLRGELMKKQFQLFYDSISVEQKSPPKILIKMGAMHTMRGKTPLGIYDIGEFTSSLASGNQQKDLNLFFMFRYYIDKEEPLGYFDNSDNNSKWVIERQPFTQQGKINQWTLIDLKSLQKFTQTNSVWVYPPLLELMKRHDYIIIPPASKDIEPNFRQ